MPAALPNPHRTLIFLALLPALATPARAADLITPAQQTALVQKYCAVCHTDAAKNGGLSLQHYDAAQPDPALAAMLLSKLRGGAMGAAGIGTPDPATRQAWVAATTAQAAPSKSWTVIRTAPVFSASIVRDVPPRQSEPNAPLYRLTLTCNTATHRGEIQLTWSPSPQTDRTFSVSADGNPPIPHILVDREEKMGNGAGVTAGVAATILNAPLPEKTLTITNLFPGETIVFPLSELDTLDRRQLAVCLAAAPVKAPVE
jgi:mono/diheme cytochrome c family protein